MRSRKCFLPTCACCVGLGLFFLKVYFTVVVTPSVPMGVWRITHTPLTRGVFIRFCLPDTQINEDIHRKIPRGWCSNGLMPMLKPIVAVGGDVVAINNRHVFINGHEIEPNGSIPKDAPFPPSFTGSYTLKQDELWVQSTYHPHSVDSRYFGPIHRRDVLSTTVPFFLW